MGTRVNTGAAVALVVFLASGLLLLTALLPAGSPQVGLPTAGAVHAVKRCGLISRGSRDYRVRARVVSCRFARTWTRVYFKNRRKPSGYRCVRRPGRVPFQCFRGRSRAYWPERL